MNLEDVVIMHESKVGAWKARQDRLSPMCIYCGHFVTRQRVEFDHFPIPKVCGGTEVVSACETCHSMKDRFAMASWPIHMVGAICRDHGALFPLLRALLANDRAQIEHESLQWRGFWENIARESRLAFAKFAAVGLGMYSQGEDAMGDGLTLASMIPTELRASMAIKSLMADGVALSEIVTRVNARTTSAKAPFGFALAADGVTLVPVEAEQATIARARELMTRGTPTDALPVQLTLEGYFSPTPPTPQ